MTEDDIIQLVNELKEDNDDDEDQDEDMETLADDLNKSHSEGLTAIEKAFRYMEHQPEFTLADRMMMRRWRDLTFRKKIESVKQKKMTDFFKQNMNYVIENSVFPCPYTVHCQFYTLFDEKQTF